LFYFNSVAFSQSVDLRSYFPSADNTYRFAGGAPYYGSVAARFVFYPMSNVPSLGTVYNAYLAQPNTGQVMIWQKMYPSADSAGAASCTYLYSFIALGAGTNKKVIEAGDWLNNGAKATVPCPNDYYAFGYQKFGATGYASQAPAFSLSNATGLNWSGANGLDGSYSSYQSGYTFSTRSTYMSNVYSGSSPASAAYSSPGLVQFLSSWTPVWARNAQGQWSNNHNKTYANVVRMVFYHGVQNPKNVSGNWAQTAYPDNCSSIGSPMSFYDLHHGPTQVNGQTTPDFYGTYAIEYYMSSQYGILQHTVLFDESGELGNSACNGIYPVASQAGGAFNDAFSRNTFYIDR
jgi:hypothetical protein